jgi:hypothetical protein
MVSKEFHEGHQDTGSAISALQGVTLHKSLLKGMKTLWRFESLNGAYGRALGLDGKHQAASYGGTVQKDGACAANPVLTANMRAGQMELVPEEIDQRQAVLDDGFMAGAIDRNFDCFRRR